MSKISELSDGGVIQGGDTLIAVRSGGNVKVTYGGTTTANIDGGTIDGTTIGGTTPAAGSFTTLQAGTSLNVDGTVTADGLTVDGTGTLSTIGNGTQQIKTYVDADEVSLLTEGSARLDLWTGGDKTMRLDANGDISFYEDTGSTAKFFWDAAAESLGIGTSSPQNLLHINKSDSLASAMQFTNSTTGATFSDGIFVGLGSGEQGYLWNYEANALILGTSNAERMRITSAGKVGIGTTSPLATLAIKGSVNELDIETTTAGVTLESIDRSDLNAQSDLSYYARHGEHKFFGSAYAERMRIDSSGNLLVGTTSAYGVGGATITAGGLVYSSVSGDKAAEFNRNTSDGDVVKFNKDGSTVGSIGVNNGTNFYQAANAGAGLKMGSVNIVASNASGASNDNTIDLGSSSTRFKDLHLSGTAHVGNTKIIPTGSGGSFDMTFQTYSGGYFERARITGDGNLLVGTTSASGASAPDNSATASDAGIRLSPTGFIGLGANQAPSGYFNRIGNDGDIIKFNKDGTAVGSIGTISSGDLYISDGRNAGIKFDGGNNQVLPVTSAGAQLDNTLDLGKSDTRFKDLYLSGGVYLGGTGSANHLDDYEEGTWTPEYATTNNDATVAYQTRRGRYIKIGNFVSITWYVEFGTVTSAGSGSIRVTGVPFQAQSNNDSRGTDTFYNVDYDSTNFLPPVSYLPSSATSALQFLLTRDAGSWAVASTSTMTVSTNDIISGSMVFRTA